MGNIGLRYVTARDDRFDKVEKGMVFRNYHKFTIASAGTADILIKTSTTYPFIFLNAKADGDTNIEILIGTTVSADGTELTSGNYNLNYLLTKTADTEFYHTPTVTDVGTHLAYTDILGGSGSNPAQQSKAAASMEGLDVILVPSTNYLIRFTNNAGREIQVIFEASFMEKTTLEV